MAPTKTKVKTEIQHVLLRLYEEGSKHVICQFWQDKPWTAAKVRITHPGWCALTAFGFAKVCYPDRWDPEFGKDLCVRKALAKMARELTNT